MANLYKHINVSMMTKQFECQRCGNCCRHSGALRITADDVKRVSAYIGLSREEFLQVYHAENIEDRIYTIPVANACPWLTDFNDCLLQEAKPLYCREYVPYIDRVPFAACQGIGHGREWTDVEIQMIKDELTEKFVIVKGR